VGDPVVPVDEFGATKEVADVGFGQRWQLELPGSVVWRAVVTIPADGRQGFIGMSPSEVE
jgi:hypothetical protein